MELTKYLLYDPDTGLITRKTTGKVAGHKRKDGYIQLRYQGVMSLAHRVIWTVINDDPGDLYIDHINNDRADNRLDNLRLADTFENCQNRSTSQGVYQRPNGRWRAAIRVRGERINLGTFTTREEARDAYVAARDTYFGVFK